ncbi:MAG: hypothetical protein L6W00_23635 [Lentisphaeria bacterium]|nr:MAG: hypothetical protein L6W00_23635 [Lentisphaeria bacterium]
MTIVTTPRLRDQPVQRQLPGSATVLFRQLRQQRHGTVDTAQRPPRDHHDSRPAAEIEQSGELNFTNLQVVMKLIGDNRHFGERLRLLQPFQ